MASPTEIKSYERIVPMIYAYNTPGVTYNEGGTKIGYTDRQKVQARIEQQTHTAGIQYRIAWKDNAIYKDSSGECFTDHDFHAYLTKRGVPRREARPSGSGPLRDPASTAEDRRRSAAPCGRCGSKAPPCPTASRHRRTRRQP